MEFGAFSTDVAREMYRRTMGSKSGQKPHDVTRDKTVQNQIYFVRMIDELLPATDALTGYTQAWSQPIRYKQPFEDTLDMEDTIDVGDRLLITNRSTSIAIAPEIITPIIWNGSEWTPFVGGGSGSISIWFTIEEVLCPLRDYVEETTLIVTIERHTGECGTSPPGGDMYDKYFVYAFCDNDLVGLTESDLIGTKGKATYSKMQSGYICECKYLIDFLCAQPECS